MVGPNGFGKKGYGLCPPGGSETYVFALYALSQKLQARPGFDPAALRKEVLDLSGDVGLLGVGYGG